MALEEKRKIVLFELESRGTLQVTIERHNIIQDILDLHKNLSNLEQGVAFRYVSEQGLDLDGIKRDTFTLFWRQSGSRFLEGEDSSFVPRATGLTRDQYVILGRILSYGYATAGIFPSFLNRVYVQTMLCGENSLTENNLIQGILDYLPVYDRERILRIMSSPSNLLQEDTEFLLDFASRGGVTMYPTRNNAGDIVSMVATAILVNTPMHTMAKLKEGMLQIPGCHRIWSDIKVEELHELYNELLPSSEKVAALLTGVCQNREEERVFSFVRRYVCSLSREKCITFLRWVTGSETLTVPKINVQFHRSTEEEPYPRAHVCGAVFDISSRGYDTYRKFCQIMDSVLHSEEVFSFSSI